MFAACEADSFRDRRYREKSPPRHEPARTPKYLPIEMSTMWNTTFYNWICSGSRPQRRDLKNKSLARHPFTTRLVVFMETYHSGKLPKTDVSNRTGQKHNRSLIWLSQNHSSKLRYESPGNVLRWRNSMDCRVIVSPVRSPGDQMVHVCITQFSGD